MTQVYLRQQPGRRWNTTDNWRESCQQRLQQAHGIHRQDRHAKVGLWFGTEKQKVVALNCISFLGCFTCECFHFIYECTRD